MTAESRLSLLTFCLAILLHLLVVIGAFRFPWPADKSIPQPVTQTLVRLRRLTPIPARLPVPSTLSPELTPTPDVPRPVLQTRVSQPTPRLMPRPQPSPVVKAQPVPEKRRVKPRPALRRSRSVTPLKSPPSSPEIPVSKQRQETPLQKRQAAVPPAPDVPPVNEAALLQSYLGVVAAKLEGSKRYPVSARRRALSGRVVLQFTIYADGRVSDPQVIESEGPAVFRTASLRTLKRVKSMPSFPPELKRQQIQVTVPIVYSLQAR